MGFSWGGAVAAEFARTDGRCRAAILLDPGGAGWPGWAVNKPLLQVNRSGNEDRSVLNLTTRDAIWFQVGSSEHGIFDDFYWWSWPSQVAGSRQIACSLNAYTLWFLNRHVKGATEPAPAGLPHVLNLLQN
jgi:pimeloyl-ACP methyl ester carboxylesterase